MVLSAILSCLIVTTFMICIHTYRISVKGVMHVNKRDKSSLHATPLVKKGKLKEISQLLNNITEEKYLHDFISSGQKAFGLGKNYDFFNATMNRYNSITVMAEYNKKSKTGFIMGMPPPEIIGGALRDAGAKAIIVSLDRRSGGVSTDEFLRFTKEQARARILIPGPLPIVWNDHIVHKIQIQYAVCLGASAIVLTPSLVDDITDMIHTCKSYEIEPIVLVKDYEECKVAIDAGARCLCMNSLEESELVALRKQLPDDPGYCYIAKLRPETDFSIYGEIDTAWVLRDNGFNCVWPSPDAIFATGMGDMYSAIIAMKSKASRLFVSPRQFMMDRTKEGAKEYLGDILY